MQKLTRLLIIYIAAAVTIVLIISLSALRGASEQTKRVESTVSSLKDELSKISSYQNEAEEILQNLNILKAEINTAKDEKVMGTTSQTQESSKPTSGFVTINDKKWQTVDVYENNSYSSKVIGKLEFDKVYPFVKKTDSWYQIKLPNSQNLGWVAGRFLREIEDSGPKE